MMEHPYLRKCLPLLLASVFSLSVLTARTQMRGPEISGSAASDSRVSGLIGFYQRYISPVDGERCLMEPGCSQYAHASITRFGILKGIILSADRLMRCGYDLGAYPRLWKNQRNIYLDEPGSSLLPEKR